MSNLLIKAFHLFALFVAFTKATKKPECNSYDDPHMTTFDGMYYEFQYTGDHYVLYDDFKETRVTASYQRCGGATCNCAVYLKKGRKIAFVDFCSASNPLSPTSQLYGVEIGKDKIGLKAIRKMPPCKIISPKDEDNERVWKNIDTFLDDFKCVRLQGSNNYDIFVLRTVERHFEDGAKIKFQLSTRSMPRLNVEPSEASFENTGGLCGMWDNNRKTELFVLDVDGVEEYLPNLNNVELAKSFWKLNSRYNKVKRCPECYVISERAFYCPCDDFDMFDTNNYEIEPPNRSTYCKVPMFQCIEKFANLNNTTPVTTTTTTTTRSTTRSTTIEQETTTTETITEPTTDAITTQPEPITIEEGYEMCEEAFLNHPSLGPLIEQGCFEPNRTLEICALDVASTGDGTFIDLHISTSLDTVLQSVLNGECPTDVLTTLCPNNCSAHGICIKDDECLNDLKTIIDDECLSPVKCFCDEPWGGIDCTTDLSKTPSIVIDKQCCDLRTESCDLVNAFGFPFSKREKLYVKIDLIERDSTGEEIILTEYTEAETLSENNIAIQIGRIEETVLFQNIYNLLPTSFQALQSMARVEISISYFNSSLDQGEKVFFTMYDSLCRECISKETDVRVDACEIDGKCFAQFETSPFDQDFFCDPDVDQTTWTLKPITTETTTETTTEETTETTTEETTETTTELTTEPTTEPATETTTEETTTELTTRTTTLTTVPFDCEFTFKIAGGRNVTVVLENATSLEIIFEIESSDSRCTFDDTIHINAKTTQHTASYNLDFSNKEESFKIDDEHRTFEFVIQIEDDMLIEPFEFFTIDFDLTSSIGIEYTNMTRYVVYIEDNDYTATATVDTTNGIFDVLTFPFVRREISIAYVSKTGSFLEVLDSYAICPWKGGITSPYDGLKILMEFTGDDTFKLHTIEVHNKEKCNVKIMNAKRLNFAQVPYDPFFLDSQSLNERAVIDVDYYKEFSKLGNKGDVLDILEINFLVTKDRGNPKYCELRAFVERN